MVKKATKTIRNTLKPVLSTARQDEDELFQTLSALPPDPHDVRLTLAGAVIGKDGKLDPAAYSDLQSAYAGEPAPAKHPDPDRPGVRKGEEVPKGLRIWDDLRAGAKGNKDGAGWIAQSTSKGEKKKEKWFNIRTCGSWRLAFLLARLQRQLWETGGRQGEPAAAAASSVGASSTTPAAATAGAQPAAPTEGDKATERESDKVIADGTFATPTKKRAAVPTAKATARKQVRRAAEPQAAKSHPATTPGAFAGSARFAAIMAARKAQEAAASGENSA